MTEQDDPQFSSAMPSAAEALELPAGYKVGDYEIVETIGRGGFGTVFKAVHPLIDKVVAIKVLHPAYSAQPQMVSRFMAEARAVNRIQHRNIIDIFGFGTIEDDLHYYVMEYLTGESLEAFVKRHAKLSLEITLGLLRPIARALHAAHDKGIAHRDLKTDNVFLAQDHDGNVEPRLLDFGIAKLFQSESVPGHSTRDGMPMGTPGYMSPEQCLGQAVDHRTDIYAFGILAYRMLTGTLPFTGDSYMRVMLAQIHTPPPPLRDIVPDLPESVEQSVLAMLAKEPADRPQTMRAALQSLESAALAAGVSLPAENSRITLPGGRQRLTATQMTPPVSGLDDLAPVGGGGGGGAAAGIAATTDAGALRRATPSRSGAGVRAQPISVTDMAAEKTPAVPRRRRPVLIGAVLALAAIAVVALRPWSPGDGETRTVASSAAVAVPEPPAPAPAVTPAITPPAPAAAPAFVAVTIEGPPEGTEVYGPAGLLGVAPGVVQLPRGDAEVMLTFKADGYRAATASVMPASATTLTVTLEPRATAPAAPSTKTGSGGKRKRDPDDRRNVLESPF
jgi:hypothetical protein